MKFGELFSFLVICQKLVELDYIPNIKIFELPVDFILHISANVLVILMKLRKNIFLITIVYL